MRKINIKIVSIFLIVCMLFLTCGIFADNGGAVGKTDSEDNVNSDDSIDSEDNIGSKDNIGSPDNSNSTGNMDSIGNSDSVGKLDSAGNVDSTAQADSAGNMTEESDESKQERFVDNDSPVTPWEYQKLLGRGMDVDWSKTKEGREYYKVKTIEDFCDAGINHVRIRIKDDLDAKLFESLDKQIDDCLENRMIPVIAYQADEFKNNPCQNTINKVVSWWKALAERYQNKSHMLSFDLMIECSDELNKEPEVLNEMIEQTVAEIRKTNPDRIIMMSPRLRSDPAYLSELKVPSKGNGYMMAEWHFYASGPSKTNDRKLWTTGTEEEKQLIRDKINYATEWQNKTQIPTWVGAWMPGDYNDGNNYTLSEQMVFADFMCDSLENAGIPFAVNSDTKFYDREKQKWIDEMVPLRDLIFK